MTTTLSRNTRGKNLRQRCIAVGAALISLMPWTGALGAAAINIPNASFESPTPPPGFPVNISIDSWHDMPNPGLDPMQWDQLTGVFANTPPGAIDHIDNIDGNQAAYLVAFQGAGIYQDLSSIYAVGQSYQLTLGVIGGGGGMPVGSSLLMSLYYRDAGNNMVPFGLLPVAYTAAEFPNQTHFIDQTLTIPAVQALDPWAGQNIGVELLCTSGFGQQGYWDVDNFRLVAVPEPSLVAFVGLGLGTLVARRLVRCRRS